MQENLSLKYPELADLFGGYFHQDFGFIHGSIENAIAEYIKTSYRDSIKKSISEITEILKDESVKKLGLGHVIYNELGSDCIFWNNDVEAKEWLLKVKKQLQAEIECTQIKDA